VASKAVGLMAASFLQWDRQSRRTHHTHSHPPTHILIVNALLMGILTSPYALVHFTILFCFVSFLFPSWLVVNGPAVWWR